MDSKKNRKTAIPVFSYNDAWRMLINSRHQDGIILDKGSTDVMLRIEAVMARLRPVGTDQGRTIWIRTQINSSQYKWLKVRTAFYEDFHYMIISDCSFMYCVLKNKEGVRSQENDEIDAYGWNYEEELLSLENHIKAVVDWICEDPGSYNSYVNHYLPYGQRDGKISLKELHKILPDWVSVPDAKKKIGTLMKIKESSCTSYGDMTLRVYISVWSECFRIVRLTQEMDDQDSYAKSIARNCRKMSDMDLFIRYNSKGAEIKGLDLDKPEDYQAWYKENSSYHCLDVVYSRIHLYPEKDKEDGPMHLSLRFDVFGYWRDVTDIVIGLYNKGIIVNVSEIDNILSILNEDAMVGIMATPDKYMDRKGVLCQLRLPVIGDDLTREQYWRLVRAVKWDKEPEVLPL